MAASVYPHAAIPESYGTPTWYRTAAAELAEDSQGELQIPEAEGEDVDDELDEESGGSEIDFGKWLKRLYKVVFGSFTSLLMLCALAGVWLVRSSMGAPWSLGAVVLAGVFGVSLAVLLLRFVWIECILKPFLPDQRILNLVTWFLDPEFGTLIWTVMALVLYATTVVANEAQMYHLRWKNDLGAFSQRDYDVYYYGILFLILWAARDALVKAVMFKLMLGFLMNFNNEVIQFLHRYSQIRRLNAAWVKLVPSQDDNTEPPAPGRGSQMSAEPMVTLNSLNENNITQRERARRQREYSKQRLIALATMTKSASKQGPSRLGSKADHFAIDIDDPFGPQPEAEPEVLKDKHSMGTLTEIVFGDREPSKVPHDGSYLGGSKWKLDFTSGQKKRREREYHVEFTGRAMPKHLEVKNILAAQRSRLSNLLAINWLREQAVVLFIDGQRCELRTKQDARAYGQQLFDTLLNFRQTLLDVEHEEKVLMVERPDIAPADVGPQAIQNVAVRRSSVASSASSRRAVEPPMPVESPASGTIDYNNFREIEVEGVREMDVSAQKIEGLNDIVGSVPVEPAFTAIVGHHEDIGYSSEEDSSSSDDSMMLVERTITQQNIHTAARDTNAVELDRPQFRNDNEAHRASPPDHSKVRRPSMERQLLEPTDATPGSRRFHWKKGQEEEGKRNSGHLKIHDWFHNATPPSSAARNGAPEVMLNAWPSEQEAQSNSYNNLRRRNGAPAPQTNAGLSGVSSAPRSAYNRAPPTEAQLAAITAAEIRKVKLQMPDDRDCLTEDFFVLFMSSNDARQLCAFLDPGKLGKITSKMFTKGVIQTYKIRKQIVHSLEAQEEIESVFSRVCEYIITFVGILLYLLLIGIDPNTIIVTGVSILTAAGLVLSFVYTDFIQSIILLVFLNPYRIGDRVRIDGEAQYVKRITTYFTEFESLHGKPQYIAHKELASKMIINESRCKNASSEINILFSERTTPSQYVAFKKVLDAYLRSRPQEFVPDSLFVYIMGIAPSHFIKVSIWVTHTDGWGNWMQVRSSESSLMHFIMRQAQILGMYYKLPVQRWEQYAPSNKSLSHPQQLPIVPPK